MTIHAGAVDNDATAARPAAAVAASVAGQRNDGNAG